MRLPKTVEMRTCFPGVTAVGERRVSNGAMDWWSERVVSIVEDTGKR